MGNVAFIGSTLRYDVTTAWPSSLSVTESDVPAGTQIGDRLILWVVMINAPTDLTNFAISTEWDTAYSAAITASSPRPRTFAYTARYGAPGVLDQTLSPSRSDGSATAAGTAWGYLLTSFTPSRSFVSAERYNNYFNAGTRRPAKPLVGNLPATSQLADHYYQSLMLAADGGSLTFVGGTPLGSPTSWIERVVPASVSGRWSGIGVGDLNISVSSSSTQNWCFWDLSVGTLYTDLVALDFDSVDDPPLTSVAGWSVGRIAY